MNRRSFLRLLGALPFLGWLKPKAEPERMRWVGQRIFVDKADLMDHRLDAAGYYRSVPFVADPSVPEGHYYMLVPRPPRVVWSSEECALTDGPAGKALLDDWFRKHPEGW